MIGWRISNDLDFAWTGARTPFIKRSRGWDFKRSLELESLRKSTFTCSLRFVRNERMKRITIHLPTRGGGGGGGSNEASESGAIVIARTMQIERDRDKRDAMSSGNGVRVSS